MAVETARRPAAAPSPRLTAAKRREWLTAYLFIAPWLITTSVFLVGLLVYAFYTSLTDRASTLSQSARFIGFNNYIAAFRNADFLISLGNVFWYFLIVTALQTIGAILLAVALNAP